MLIDMEEMEKVDLNFWHEVVSIYVQCCNKTISSAPGNIILSFQNEQKILGFYWYVTKWVRNDSHAFKSKASVKTLYSLISY